MYNKGQIYPPKDYSFGQSEMHFLFFLQICTYGKNVINNIYRRFRVSWYIVIQYMMNNQFDCSFLSKFGPWVRELFLYKKLFAMWFFFTVLLNTWKAAYLIATKEILITLGTWKDTYLFAAKEIFIYILLNTWKPLIILKWTQHY